MSWLWGSGSSSNAQREEERQLALNLEFSSAICHKMVKACHKKCIDRYAEPELTIGEGTCTDRCAYKYYDVLAMVGNKVNASASSNAPILDRSTWRYISEIDFSMMYSLTFVVVFIRERKPSQIQICQFSIRNTIKKERWTKKGKREKIATARHNKWNEMNDKREMKMEMRGKNV